MQLNTLDLYYIDQCSKWWKEDPPKREETDPTRKLMKKVLLMKAIGRESRWTFNRIATVWDQLFWEGKDITRDNMKESVQGILAARQLYNKLPKEKNLEAYSTLNLTSNLDSGIQISSAGDFLLSYPDRYETWIHIKSSPKRIRRSPLPVLEDYLAQQKIRDFYKKPFFLVAYYSSIKRRRAIHFRVRNNYSLEETRKIVFNLADKAKKEIYYPSIGEHCEQCKVKC